MTATAPHLLHGLRRFTTLALLLALAGCAAPQKRADRGDPLSPVVLEKMQAAQIPEDALGGVVLRVSDGRVLWSREAARPMQPASTIKVLTSIVALETLKPSYRAKTLMTTAAAKAGDVLRGDIALIGQGSSDFDDKALAAMLRKLRAEGVGVIEGDLILDREFFQPPREYASAPAFDEAPEFRYNIVPDALLLNSNLNPLALASNDNELRIVFGPSMDRVQFVSGMTLVDKPCAEWEDWWKIPRVEKMPDETIRVTLLGEFPKRCEAQTEINVLDRTDYAERLFRSLWRELGGSWRGRAREAVAPKDARTIATHESRSFAEVNRDINKRSDNALTRIAYLTLGVRDAVVPSAIAADAKVRAWLASKNIDTTGLVIENGSGLSRKEMIAPLTLANTLRAAHASPWANEFMMSLPIVGVDGAMHNRLLETRAALTAQLGRMKTGGLRNVTSVAGYLPAANGEAIAVVLIFNHDNARGAKGRAVLDELMREFLQKF